MLSYVKRKEQGMTKGPVLEETIRKRKGNKLFCRRESKGIKKEEKEGIWYIIMCADIYKAKEYVTKKKNE